MKTNEIRTKFLDFFAKNNHTIVPSSSLVPHNDKTLLFTNAGMVQFKDIFSGKEKKPYSRAATCQKCVRAGGKHNDLENVGYTARHHTFFEMLGNFSFGDYFKKEAIQFAWDFITKELKIPEDRLWVSIFEDDDEAEKIWVEEIGFPRGKISRCGIKDNFWAMGDTGPCGPCSEIFYDHGKHIPGGPPGHANEDGDRFVEIWNLVFTQFDRQNDGYLKPLSHPCVDTGMGLERIAAVIQHKNNNYDIDTFQVLTKQISKLGNNIKPNESSVRVIADHIRSVSFMIADGILPANEGRGYVLRRIIRRAVRHGYKLNIRTTFFYKLVKTIVKTMESAYPQLKEQQENIERILEKEEDKFYQTLAQGMDILEETISNLKSNTIPGKTAFKLYDTYGFPLDLTMDIARERNLKVDTKSFDLAMQKQKDRAKKANTFSDDNNSLSINIGSEFSGYKLLKDVATIKAINLDNNLVNSLEEGSNAIIVLDKTPFYAESGGQIGDSGVIKNGDIEFKVKDTQKQASGAIEHYGHLEEGSLKVGDKIVAKVDIKRRNSIARNHSATHLLHAALREILGKTVEQKGSLVDANKLRFDFSYDEAIKKSELNKIEMLVNSKILANTKVYTAETDIETAKKKGAMAFFDEKYEDIVRVLTMGADNFSIELCGGTHVKNLGDIGLFKIVQESSIASGVRRIEALTGYNAYKYLKDLENDFNKIADLTKATTTNLVAKVELILLRQKELEKQLAKFQKDSASSQIDDLIKCVVEINGVKVLAQKVVNIQPKDMRGLIDKLKDRLSNAVILLASTNDNKAVLNLGVTNDITDKYHAGELLNFVATQIGGKGGGRANMAQGGGSNIANLDKALASLKTKI